MTSHASVYMCTSELSLDKFYITFIMFCDIYVSHCLMRFLKHNEPSLMKLNLIMYFIYNENHLYIDNLTDSILNLQLRSYSLLRNYTRKLDPATRILSVIVLVSTFVLSVNNVYNYIYLYIDNLTDSILNLQLRSYSLLRNYTRKLDPATRILSVIVLVSTFVLSVNNVYNYIYLFDSYLNLSWGSYSLDNLYTRKLKYVTRVYTYTYVTFFSTFVWLSMYIFVRNSCSFSQFDGGG